MPVSPAPASSPPQYWTFFGHSYYQLGFGTRTQQGRADGFLRMLLDTQQGLNVQNHAAAGSRLTIAGDNGYGRVLQLIHGWTGGAGQLGNGAPWTIGGMGGSGGAYLLGWGINDVGYNGQTAQMNTAYIHALRTVVSRCRMSVLGSSNNWNYPGGCGTFAATGMAQAGEAGFVTGSGVLFCSGAGATMTITLPADYAGEVVAISFVGQPGGAGGTITFTGTAGVTGAINIENIMPAASANNVPYTRRITNLTSANAGQTIIMTVTTMNNWVYFDSWWLEADNPPPVIITNTARLCSSPNGYNVYALSFTATGLNGNAISTGTGTITLGSGTTLSLSQSGFVTCPSTGGTVTITYTGITATTLTGCTTSGGSGTFTSNTLTWAGITDADVVAFNAVLPALVAEFDSMVQVADLDSALNKSAALFCYDGLHPNELGASRVASAIVAAVGRLVPTGPWGAPAGVNPPAPVITPLSRPWVTGQFYTSDCFGGANGTAYTPVIGDVFALPVFITTGTAAITNWVMEMVTSTVAPTVFMAVFDDRQMAGYPQWMASFPANFTPLSLLAAPGVFTSTNTGGANGFIGGPYDGGLYWLTVKWLTTGTCTIRTCKGPSLWVPNLTATGAGGTTPCGWKLTGQGTTAFSGRFPSGAVASDNVPMIGLKAQT